MAKSETDLTWRCPRCANEILVRDSKTGYCMDCMVPTYVEKERCSKCGRMVIKKNPLQVYHYKNKYADREKKNGLLCFRCCSKMNPDERIEKNLLTKQ